MASRQADAVAPRRGPLHWGVDTNPVAAWRIVFSNAVLITFFFLGAGYTVLFYAIGATLLAAFVPPILVGFAAVLWLNRIGRFRVGRVIHVFLFDLVILYYSASLGEATNIHHLFLAAMTLSLVLGEERELGFLSLAVFLPLVCWFALELTDYHLGFVATYTIAPETARLVAGSITGTTALLLFLSMAYLYRHTEELEQTMHRALVQLDGEMRLASDIRTALLPRAPLLPGFEHAELLLAKGENGADFYDVVPDDQGGGWIFCGTSTGRGVATGLQQLMLQSTARTLITLDPGADPATLVQQIDSALAGPLTEIGGDARLAVTLMRLDAPGRLRVAGSCGRVLVQRFAAEQPVETIVPSSAHATEVALARGDRALFCSAGAISAEQGGVPLGTAGLGARLRLVSQPPQSPERTLEALRTQLFGFSRTGDALLLVVAREDLFASFELSPDWRTLEQVRSGGAQLLAELPRALADAALMTAIELAENAVKYGMQDGAPAPCIEIFVDAQMVEVAVVSRDVNAERVAEAKRLIDRINDLGTAEELYLERMRILMAEETNGSGMGFLRISHEGGFSLSYEQEPNAFYILARRSFA